MYHCHLRFYFVGHQRRQLQILKEMPPLEAFTHAFFESNEPEKVFTEQASVILASLVEMDATEAARTLAAAKQQDTQLILLVDSRQAAELAEHCGDVLNEVADLWILPMSDGELRFRFIRWQQAIKARKDAWQTEQYLEATINGSPNLIWYKTKDGLHEKVNNSFCAAVGKTREQVEGRGHAYIWDVEQDDPSCIESERIVMERGETCVFEENIQAGGEAKTLTTYKSPLYDLDGSIMGTARVGIDVTLEQAYARELLQKSQLLEKVFTTMDCGVLCHTLDGKRIISVNEAALRILGYSSKEEMMENGFLMIAQSVLDEDKPKLRECIRSLKGEGDSVGLEYRVQHANGDILYVMGTFRLIAEGGELYFQRFLLDCTVQKKREEQKRLEDRRRQMELIHALSIEYVLVCVFDLDTSRGRALRINDSENGILEHIFSGELLFEDCIGRYIEEGVHAEDRPLLQTMTRKQLEGELSEKDMYYLNYRTICGGETKYFQMKAVRAGAWEDTRNIVLGIRSIDEETREEREKKALLEDALSQANRASRAKSVFLSNMSHDIRTPMNAIIGFTALAISHIDRKEQVEEYLKKIMTSGNHLLSLINDVLDMSRIESGKIRLEEQPCSLPDILHGLRNIIQADIHAKQLELYMDAVDIQNEEICCDRLRLNQVLLNLLSNAVKYTGSGGIVSMRVSEKPGAPAGCGNYVFCVKDTGIGMSEEFVAHIFEPFERERNSTISGIQGTGLGMAITKNIVEMMNGSIEVKSRQGVGTECTVSFTFHLHSGGKEVQTLPELKGFRALVVDDDFNTCDSVSWMLQQIGMRAEWTLSGKEAVLRTRQAVMRDDSYFVYIIDWLLPDMNGIETARRIRQETGKEVPIIILTAYDWSDIEEEAKDAGVTAFCSKPLFLSELRGCLSSIVSKEKGAGDGGTPQRLSYTGRILLAEDNDLNGEIATAILEEAGFTVDIAQNGEIAVDMLKKAGADYYRLVLMDVQMPVMNGYEATRRIRSFENKDLASIPILAMTANAFEEDRREAMNCGMDGHISKPIDIQKLLDTLDEALRDRASQNESSSV